MSENKRPENSAQGKGVSEARRAALRRLGRYAAVTPPAVTLLLAAGTKSAKAETTSLTPLPSSRQFKEPVSIPQLQGAA